MACISLGPITRVSFPQELSAPDEKNWKDLPDPSSHLLLELFFRHKPQDVATEVTVVFLNSSNNGSQRVKEADL